MKKFNNKISIIIFSLLVLAVGLGFVSPEVLDYFKNNNTIIENTTNNTNDNNIIDNNTTTSNNSDTIDKNEILDSFQEVADYIHKYNKLPDNFITKKEAMNLGWSPGDDLWKYAPNKSIGGDHFGNYENALPSKEGRTWTECDINYKGGSRGSDRIVFSNDGLIYGTSDHYKTFIQYY